MDVVFTRHAAWQLRERRIHKVWVYETVASPDFTRREGNKYYVVKKLDGMTLKVVYTKEKHIKIITTYFLK
jgi:hypothetical protein